MYGDLSKLSDKDKLEHYKRVCESVGLNPLTSPLQYIPLNGKLVLYASKNTTEQLRATHNVSVVITSREKLADIYVVTARATMPSGRCDESIGSVNITGLKGDALANALMKAETKAKRRVTLSICSLGMLDETEVETIIQPQSQPKPKEPPKAKPEIETKQDSPPVCKTCNGVMKVSKNGLHWYCDNWRDGREHKTIRVSKPIEREVGPPVESLDDIPLFDSDIKFP